MRTLIFLLMLSGVSLVSSVNAQNCQITFSSHSNGAVIANNPVSIDGTATVPPGGHLWLLAHVRGFHGWYPQGNGESTPQGTNNRWDCLVYLGNGKNGVYEVCAVIVNDAENASLMQWVNAPHPPYNPIPFPNVMQGCAPVTLQVSLQQ